MSNAYGYKVEEQDLQTEAADVPAGGMTIDLNAVAEGVEVFFPSRVDLHIEFTRNALHTSLVILYFAAIGAPGMSFPNVPSFSVAVDLNDSVLAALGGPTEIIADAIVDADAYYAIKLLAIDNPSATYDLSGVRVKASYKL